MKGLPCLSLFCEVPCRRKTLWWCGEGYTMRRGRFAVAVLLGLVFNVPGYAQGAGRSYTLTPYDVPTSMGNNTSLFDLQKGGQFAIGTYFSNKQNAFGVKRKKGTVTPFNLTDSFINFVIAVSPVAIVGSADLPNGKRVGTIWPHKRSAGVWKKALGISLPFPPSAQGPIIIDIENYKSTALLGLNARGDVVGAVQKQDFTFSGLAIIDGTISIFDYPGAQSTQAEGIRTDGTMVGTYTFNNTSHGFFRYPNGQFESFDVPQACETFIYDTNDKGDLAGAYREQPPSVDLDCASQQMRGYVLTRKDQLLVITFPRAGTTATEVQGLDEKGNIAGRFDDATGRHGFLGLLE